MKNPESQKIGVKKKRWVVCFENTILDLGLSIYEKMVYIVLCAHAKKDGPAFPCVMTIAREASCSRTKVFEALKTLEEQGIITRENQIFPKRGQTSNLYEIIDIEPRPPRGQGEGNPPPPSVIGTGASVTRTGSVSEADAPLDVLEQDHLNKINEHSPLTPQTGEKDIPQQEQREREEQNTQEPEPMTQRGEKEAKPTAKTGPETPKPSPESDLFEVIRETYNSTLPELPKAEKITVSRAKVLRQRIRESSERKEPAWWKKFFSNVRDFPWPMGQNKDNWRADFDWLIGERGMQKILEGGFLPFRSGAALNETADEWLELEKLEKKYTDERGLVDGKAILREIDAAAHRRGFFKDAHGAGIGDSRGNPGGTGRPANLPRPLR
jgi:predicted transcriptional regulator